MEKYINRILGIARTVGTVKTIDMADANKWHPSHIVISGVTQDDDKFTIELEIGNKKNEEE